MLQLTLMQVIPSNTTYRNELNEYFRNCSEKIAIRTVSHGLTHKLALPRITWLFVLLRNADNSVAIQFQVCLATVFPLNFTGLL